RMPAFARAWPTRASFGLASPTLRTLNAELAEPADKSSGKSLSSARTANLKPANREEPVQSLSALRELCVQTEFPRAQLRTRRLPSARLYSAVPMLQVWPSISTRSVGVSRIALTASSRIRVASGRSV